MSTATAAQFKLDNTNTTSTPAITITPVEQSLPTTASTTTSTSTTSQSTSTTTSKTSSTLLTGNAVATAASVPTTGDRIEWSRATILGFIEDYRRQRVLWDPNTKGYHIKQTKYEALKALSHKYGTEIRSIRSKIKSLRSSFHREHGKVLNGRNRGVHYQPMWFAYEAIRFILDGERGGGGGGGGNGGSNGSIGGVIGDADDDECNGNGCELLLPTELAAQPEEKLALMQSLDLELLMRGKAATITKRIEKLEPNMDDVEEDGKFHDIKAAQQHQSTQQQEFLNAAVAAMAAAAAVAAMSKATTTTTTTTPMSTPTASSTPVSNLDEQAMTATANHMAAATMVGLNGASNMANNGEVTEAAASAVTRSDLLDGENYCNISAEDVKTEIIEPDDEPELTIFGRRHATPSPINYNKPTDLTFTRKRKNLDDHMSSSSSSSSSSPNKQRQQHPLLSGNPLAFNPHITLHPLNPITHGLHGFSSNQILPQQQFQQQHSNNNAHKQQQQRVLSPVINTCAAHSNSLAAAVSSSSNSNIASSTSMLSGGTTVSANNISNHNNNNNNNNNSNLHISSTSNNSNNHNHNNNNSNSNSNSNNNNNNNTSNNNGQKLSANHVDEYGVFGEYVAITIRKLKTSKAKIVVKHLINNLLYEAELGKYDHGIPASKEPPQLYKMQ